MTDKLKRKIARQNAKTEQELTDYKLGQKSSTTRRTHARGNLWNDRDCTKESDYKMKLKIAQQIQKLYK